MRVLQSGLLAGCEIPMQINQNEDYTCDGKVVFTSSMGGVMIDLNARGFVLGFGGRVPHEKSNFEKYKGRGWKQKLVDDAIAALENAVKGK